MAEPKPDTYADLDALAAKGDGRLWHAREANVWSYPACPLSPATGNLRAPVESAPDARVRAALDAGAWAVAVLDNLAVPPRILAVQKAPEGAAVRMLTPTDLGTSAAA